jgi:hypothetical protein
MREENNDHVDLFRFISPTMAKELLRHRGTYTLYTDRVHKDNYEEMNESCLGSIP